jgi:hypothetical protein
VSGGSYAAASVHQAIRQDLIEADARTLSTCLREQVVRWWAEYNLGKAELAPWPEWETEPPQSVQGTAQALGAIAQAVGALKQIGVEVDSRALLERTGVGVMDAGAEVALADHPWSRHDPLNGQYTSGGALVRFIEGPDDRGSGGDTPSNGGKPHPADRPFTEDQLREPDDSWKRKYLVDEQDVREEFELSPTESDEQRVAKKRELLETAQELGLEPKRDGPLDQPEVMTQDEHEKRLGRVLKALYLDGVRLDLTDRLLRAAIYEPWEGIVPVRKRLLQRAKNIRRLQDERRQRDESRGGGSTSSEASKPNRDRESRQYERDVDTIKNPPAATGKDRKEMKKIRDENLR